jgi:hypothetical protein
MNRHHRRTAAKQRQAATPPPPDPYASGIAELHAEAAGLMRFVLLSPAECCLLAAQVLLFEHQEDLRLLRGAVQVAKRIADAPAAQAILCLCCPKPIRDPDDATICLTLAAAENPKHAIGSALCQSCAAAPGVNDRVITALRSVWPDVRRIEITHADGGRA